MTLEEALEAWRQFETIKVLMSAGGDKMSKQFNVKVVYEPRRVSRIAVECPRCKKWFRGNEIKTGRYIEEEYEIYYGEFRCPICNEAFGRLIPGYYGDDRYEPVIEETDDDEDIYKDCLTKKTVWE